MRIAAWCRLHRASRAASLALCIYLAIIVTICTADACVTGLNSAPITSGTAQIIEGDAPFNVTSYAPGLRCEWQLTFGAGKTVRITIPILHLNPGSSDHIMLYEGTSTNAPILAAIYNFTRDVNAAARTRVYDSKSNTIHVVFISDPMPKTWAFGFKMNFTERASPVVYCSGLNTLISANTTGVSFYPFGQGVTSYYGGVPCGYLLQSSAVNGTLKVSGNTFYVDDWLSNGDSVVLFDGPDTSAPVLLVWAISQYPMWYPYSFEVASSGRHVYMLFNSTIGDKGLTMSPLVHVTGVPYEETPLYGCSGDVAVYDGDCVKFGFPNPVANLSPGTLAKPFTTCRWLIDPLTTNTAAFTIRLLTPVQSSTCYPATFGYLRAYRGRNASAPLIEDFYEHLIGGVAQYYSDDGPIYIEYDSGSSAATVSFNIILRQRTNIDFPAELQDLTYAPSGLSYGNYRSGTTYGVCFGYEGGSTTAMNITTAIGQVRLSFYGQPYQYLVGLQPGDYIEVYDVRSTGVVFIGYLVAPNGTATDGFTSSEGTLRLRQVLGDSKGCYPGIQFIASRISDERFHCDDSVTTINIFSSNYQRRYMNEINYNPYATFQTCRWRLTTTYLPYILFQIFSLDMAPGDTISIYDGVNETAPLLGTFTRDDNPINITFYSSGDTLYGVFVAGSGNVAPVTYAGYSFSYAGSPMGPPTSCGGLITATRTLTSSGMLGQTYGYNAYFRDLNWPTTLANDYCVFSFTIATPFRPQAVALVTVSMSLPIAYFPPRDNTSRNHIVVHDGDATSGVVIDLMDDPSMSTATASAFIFSGKASFVFKAGASPGKALAITIHTYNDRLSYCADSVITDQDSGVLTPTTHDPPGVYSVPDDPSYDYSYTFYPPRDLDGFGYYHGMSCGTLITLSNADVSSLVPCFTAVIPSPTTTARIRVWDGANASFPLIYDSYWPDAYYDRNAALQHPDTPHSLCASQASIYVLMEGPANINESIPSGSVLAFAYAYTAPDIPCTGVEEVFVPQTWFGAAADSDMINIKTAQYGGRPRDAGTPIHALALGPTYNRGGPGYRVGGYPKGMVCGWHLTSPAGSYIALAVSINTYDDDYVTVYYGSSPSGTIAARYSGVTIDEDPPWQEFNASELFIEFRAVETQYTYSRSGFAIHARAYAVPTQCSGDTTIQLPDLFYDVSYPRVGLPSNVARQAARYAANSHCVLHIEAFPGQILFGFVEIATDPGDDVRVYDSTGILIAARSGWFLGEASFGFYSIGPRITIEFRSNNVSSNMDAGFHVNLCTTSIGPTLYPYAVRLDPDAGVCNRVHANTTTDPRLSYCDVMLDCLELDAPSTTNGTVMIGRYINTILLLLPSTNTTLFVGGLIAVHQLGLDTDAQLIFLDLQRVTLCIALCTTDAGTAALRFPVLVRTGDITSQNYPSLKELDMPSLVYAEVVCLETVQALSSLSFPLLVVAKSFHISKCAQLEAVSHPLLTSVPVGYALSSLGCLRSVTLSALQQCTAITLSELPKLETVEFISLQFINQLAVTSSGALTLLALPTVALMEGITLTNCPSLNLLDAPIMQQLGKLEMNVVTLNELHVPRLSTVETLKLTTLSGLTSLILPGVRSIGGLVVDSGSLTTITLPGIREIDQLALKSNTFLSGIDICNVNALRTYQMTLNPSLSCYDFNTVVSPHFINYEPRTVADCNPAESGVFGCQYGVTLTVDTNTCGFTVACIQATIDVAYSGQGISVYVPTGRYLGCASGPLDLKGKALILYGAGINASVIDCQGVEYALHMDQGEPAETLIRDIGFANGMSTIGGAAFIDGSFATFLNVAFSGNSASISGGAVSISGGAAPTFMGCVFSANQAPSGGAIAVADATLTMGNCTLSANTAGVEGGAIHITSPLGAVPMFNNVTMSANLGARGGAVFSDSALTMIDSMVTGNSANQFGGGLALVPLEPLGVWVNVTRVTFAANLAPTGGGIYSFSAHVLLYASRFLSNSATASDGGGMLVMCSASYRFLNNIKGACDVHVLMTGTSFVSNSAIGNGGGVVFRQVMVQTIILTCTSNLAGKSGGGVYASQSVLRVGGSVFQLNRATQSGGATYCEPFTGACEITSSVFSVNTASVGGGAIFLCTAACPGTNLTTGAPITKGVLPDWSNTPFAGNVVGSGYGVDYATDPSNLYWLVQPAPTAVSGRTVVNGSDPITVLVKDGYGQTVTSSASSLALSLFALNSDGSSATDRVTVSGPQTVLAQRGVATFPGITLVAKQGQRLDVCQIEHTQ